MFTRVYDYKIAFFLPSVRGGGAEKSIVKMCNELVTMGASVDLVLVKYEGSLLNYISDQVNVVDLKCSRSILSVFKLAFYLINSNPDALISAMKHANIPAILAREIAKFIGFKTKLLISERSNASKSFENNKSFKNNILLLSMSLLYPKADKVIGISKGVSQDLAQLLNLEPEKVHTIYNPVVNNELFTLCNVTVEEDWFKKIDHPIIIAVGRLTKAKGFDNLIKAFAKVSFKINCYLVILGEGEERESLETLIGTLSLKDKVYMPGFVNNPYKFMKHSDVFVLSSVWEGFGNVLVEAICCGCKIVSNDCPSGPKEIIESYNVGTLVPFNNVNLLSEAIIQELGAEPYLAIDNTLFTVEKCVDEYLKELEKL